MIDDIYKNAFKEVFDVANKEDWPLIEKAYIMELLNNFVFWSLKVIDNEYRIEFVKLIRKLYKNINNSCSLFDFFCSSWFLAIVF